jgi:hypothetical protein
LKRQFFSIFLIAVVFILGGCGTHKPVIFDETLPETETATIYWCGTGNYVRPAAYNGIKVDWYTDFVSTASWGYYPIIIPAGESTFELEGYTAQGGGSWGSTKWNYTGINFSYNFVKGQVYTVYFIGGNLTIHSGKSLSNDTILEKIQIDWSQR